MPIAGQFNGQVEVAAVLQTRCVAGGPMTSLVVRLVDMLELGAQNARVQVVEPAVEPETVDVARVRAVVAQFADPRVDVRVVGHHRAAVAKGAEILLDDETDRRRVAEFSDLEAAAVSANPS